MKLLLQKITQKQRWVGCLLLLACHYLPAQVLFTNQAALQGITEGYGPSFTGGGVSFCDFDRDGLDDITLATDAGQPIGFYRNTGNGFEKLPPLVAIDAATKQILWADFDNDGDSDLFVATVDQRNFLFRNTGNLNLIDITQQAGLPMDDFDTYGACFGDFNRDGWLDLYLGKRKGLGTELNGHYLFKNNADGTFTDVTAASGTEDAQKIPFCSSFFDLNNDNWPDLYTAHDKLTINTLLRNKGDGTFEDISSAANADLAMNAMSVTIGDYNNDGFQDIYITNTPQGNALLKNLGNDTFEEVAEPSGVGFFSVGWGANFLDADNDGDQDLYVSGSEVGANVNSSAFYQNEGDGNFSQPNAGFAGDTVSSFNNALGDFNDDGFYDIIVQNIDPAPAQLWRNGGNNNHWIKIQLEGVLSNRDGIGARLELHVNGQTQYRYTHCGIGFLGQNSRTEIFGLGQATQADSIIVLWPSGHLDRLYEVQAGERLLIQEGSTTGGVIDVDPDIDIVLSLVPPSQKRSEVLVYPNPIKDQLTVQFPLEWENGGLLYIVDARGTIQTTLPFTAGQKVQQLQVGNWSTGYYWLLIYPDQLNAQHVIIPFVKQ